MNAEDMKSLTFGEVLVYDDRRPGHRGVLAIVLSNHKHHVLVQFADRADTTVIKHNDSGWTNNLRKVGENHGTPV